MSACVYTKENFWDIIDNIIINSTSKDPNYITNFIKSEINDLFTELKDSPDQLNLFKEAFEDFYNEDEYAEFLHPVLSKASFDALWEDLKTGKNITNPDPLSLEDQVNKKHIVKLNNFMDMYFGNNQNAKLYFTRTVDNDLVETFLINRSGENIVIYESQLEMNESVYNYKLKLLDRIFEYLDNYNKSKIEVLELKRQLYSEKGYTGIIKQLKPIFNKFLEFNTLEKNVFRHSMFLDDAYTKFKNENSLEAKLFLNAYNAWVILLNFDTVVQDNMGTIIQVHHLNLNGYDKHLTKYELKSKATNMWTTWLSSDDIADMSEIISDVALKIISTSKVYSWGNAMPFEDKYLTFADFNYAIGLIKNIATNVHMDDVIITPALIQKCSPYTQRIILDLLYFNKTNNIVDPKSGNPLPVTLKSLVACLNQNPQRYLHTIFDVICATYDSNNLENIVDKIKIKNNSLTTYLKNVIWSVFKEFFGGDKNPRSLYHAHTQFHNDNIYPILTQISASTFPEEFLLYYEDENGIIKTRLLGDYSEQRIKDELFSTMLDSAYTITSNTLNKYNIGFTEKGENPKLLNEISIPIINGCVIKASTDNIVVLKSGNIFDSTILNSPELANLIKDFLGIDFTGDFKTSYLEITKNVTIAREDICKLLGRVVFNSIVNAKIIPGNKLNTKQNLEKFITSLYPNKNNYTYKYGNENQIAVLPSDTRSSDLSYLAQALALNFNLNSQAQSLTGEGTQLSNYTLSRLRNFYHNLLEMQCKKYNSAVKHLDFVTNSNKLFEGIYSRREIKTKQQAQQSTKFSTVQSFTLSFINDFLSGMLVKGDPRTYIKEGRVSFLPTVNSDKSQIDGLLVNLFAQSHILDENGGFKTYLELTDSEIEQEMRNQFQPMYNNIVENINKDLLKVCEILNITDLILNANPCFNTIDLLHKISAYFIGQETLELRKKLLDPYLELNAKQRKNAIINGLHKVLSEYNKTHTRNPIMLSQEVHYVFNNDGYLSPNKVLQALWARFNYEKIADEDLVYFDQLYGKESDYLSFLDLNRNENTYFEEGSALSFFKYKDYLTVRNLINMGFKLPLYGSDKMVRQDQPEIKFLRGETIANLPPYLQILSGQMSDWVSSSGEMVLAKGYDSGELIDITTEELLKQCSGIIVHPLLRKLNRLDYLCTQQYTVSTVGSHYAHKGFAKDGNVLTEEALRWLASNKRNVAATSTVHLFQNKQLNGSPTVYNIAVTEDAYFDLYDVMGDLYIDGHKPLDGGMHVNAFMPDLENNSLNGERAGDDKKQFGTFYDEKFAAGGIIKTAGFAITNARMRRNQAYINLLRNMSNKVWVKEFAGENGEDIQEILDITKNEFLNCDIDYTLAINGLPIFYKRVYHDNPKLLANYKLLEIQSLGNNKYVIKEVEVDAHGKEINKPNTRTVDINTNWKLFTEVFGGYNSLQLNQNGTLVWSENSRKLMVHAINNIGYKKMTNYASFGQEYAHLDEFSKNLTTGLDLDDVWLPLKHSDIHYHANIGAIKSLYYNINPDIDIVLNEETILNFFKIRLAQLGIQLDKEHIADLSEVSMPTQIISALANKSFTSEYAKEAYEALSILAQQATKPFLDGIKQMLASESGATPDISILVEEVSDLLLTKLLSLKSENNSMNAILSELLEKIKTGTKLSYEEIAGKLPLSDPTIYNKLFSDLSTTLTNMAIKIKLSGVLSVICPGGPMEKFYGDFMLNHFTLAVNEDGTTRTELPETKIDKYQQSVIEGNEVDSEDRNLLVFDINRDISELSPQEEGESDINYTKRINTEKNAKKLSLVSEMKTQHNYVIEFDDGSTQEITLNTPEQYYDVKNLIVRGKISKSNTTLDTPMLWDDFYQEALSQLNIQDASNSPIGIVLQYLQEGRLLHSSVATELGYKTNSTEMKKYIGLFKSKQKGGVSVERLAEIIYENNPQYFQDDVEIKNLIIDILLTNKTIGDIRYSLQNILNEEAIKYADQEFGQYEDYILLKYQKTSDEYLEYYQQETQTKKVVKIYENVKKERELAAYNIRFNDENTGLRYQMYDLDSINFLFKLNRIYTKKPIKGYDYFLELSDAELQNVLNLIFKSPIFLQSKNIVLNNFKQQYPEISDFDSNFIENFKNLLVSKQNVDVHETLKNTIQWLYDVLKPKAYRIMQKDLLKLSDTYKGSDRSIIVNGRRIIPTKIKADAYELIMPKIFKTLFGLNEFDDLLDILRDKDFFIKRGLERFKCKLDHKYYDYELKNFNGEHIYIIDESKGIPEELKSLVHQIQSINKKGKIYRIDSDESIIYQMSSKNDYVVLQGNVQIIVTKNPLFYVQNFNYNTLKTNPKRVTEDSYKLLLETLSESKRTGIKNFLQAIKNPDGTYFDLKTFKDFNTKLDEITYDLAIKDTETLKADNNYKSIAQLCKLIVKTGRELHTSFDESLNIIAGRIPAQSQLSFMTQRVVAFDDSAYNTAMVSTFQLFLQGSDLDIDAVTLIGYDFNKYGKFIGWSPYFNLLSREHLLASKNIPMPTGELQELVIDQNAKGNFFEIYDKYFGTLFKLIPNENKEGTWVVDDDGTKQIRMVLDTPELINLLAQFLRDVKIHGITLQGTLLENGDVKYANKQFQYREDGSLYNIFTPIEEEGLAIDYKYAWKVGQQLVKLVNDHNIYIAEAEEHLQTSMAKNYLVHYIYKTVEDPSNQTEALKGIDEATEELKNLAKNSIMAQLSDSYAPGGVETKHMAINEGLVGKSCVGIGAVALKVNSAILFYMSQLLKQGLNETNEKYITFPAIIINSRQYDGFAGMYTDTIFSDEERTNYIKVMNLLDNLWSDSLVTKNVCIDIAALLSISVDNAKNLAIAKINAGPRFMGMFAYGISIGVPTTTLVEIINSKQGRILKDLTEENLFTNEFGSFGVLLVFDKLDGKLYGDLSKYDCYVRNNQDRVIRFRTNVNINNSQFSAATPSDILFAGMYPEYIKWIQNPAVTYKPKLAATSFGQMIEHLIKYNIFTQIYNKSKANIDALKAEFLPTKNDDINNLLLWTNSLKNWNGSLEQLINFILDIYQKSYLFRSSQGTKGQSLKNLARGAEEMRILGSILGLNKGLKSSPEDLQSLIDTIENLIIDRKNIDGKATSPADKIDFVQFVMNPQYQQQVIERYNQCKVSVNIPHLLVSHPQYFSYLKTAIIPEVFYRTASYKYRISKKYTLDIFGNEGGNLPIYKFFEVDGKKNKKQILRGLNDLIHFKVFQKWLSQYNNGQPIIFEIPAGFEFFSKHGTLITTDKPIPISLNTLEGLATFKKYMDEVVIPKLLNNSLYATNAFVQNLIRVKYDKTPNHRTVSVTSLLGDLMAKKGSLGELNLKMFADFLKLQAVPFPSTSSIANFIDAMYIYSLYCYMGRKGKSSLMFLFDNVHSRSALAKSFNEFEAALDFDATLDITLTPKEIIEWCAPIGNQHLKAAYGYVSDRNEFGVSLQLKLQQPKYQDSEEAQAAKEAQQEAMEAMADEGIKIPKKLENFGRYGSGYEYSFYNRIAGENFLIPTGHPNLHYIEHEFNINNLDKIIKTNVRIRINSGDNKINELILTDELKEALIQSPGYKNWESRTEDTTYEKFIQNFLLVVNNSKLKYHIFTESEQSFIPVLNIDIIKNIIELYLNCK